MPLTPLTAISPIDGRYFRSVETLSQYFSEYGLIRYRIQIEIEYFIALSATIPEMTDFPVHKLNELRRIYKDFSEADAEEIKKIEAETNHDVKAVEYFIKKRFDDPLLEPFREYIHFGLTSQDINNTAIPLLVRDFMQREYQPHLTSLISRISQMSKEWQNVPMLAYTHGQPASPTRLGKELMVFVSRLEKQMNLLKTIPFSAKFGGATGNFNAHHVAYPEIDWNKFGDEFCKHLGLSRSIPTTQIEHYDNLAALFDNLKRINTIFIDFSRDIWQYISMNYFRMKIADGEVGSSAMPHKVNPIDFENAEGNLGFANAIFDFMSSKLPVSRLQRDLTDSTVLRNIGVPVAHSLIAFKSLERGIRKLELNEETIRADLDDNWAVIAEAIQTILRKEGFANPYETLKDLTRTHEKITRETIHNFIDTLDIKPGLKARLKKITPFNYTGI
ncbi:MAG TPA: adenylosuccinate lyase [Cyclobacteriaceae bacterium]